AAATAAASEGWRPSTTSGTPASSTTVPRPRSRAACRASSTEAKPVAVTTNTRAVSSFRNRTVEGPRGVGPASNPVAAAPGGEGAGVERVRLGGGGWGGRCDENVCRRGVGLARSGRAFGRRGAVGRLGGGGDRHDRGRRRGQAPPSRPGPRETVRDQPRDDD